MQNHVNDPNFFNDAIALFAFNYDWYSQNSYKIDDLGRKVNHFEKMIINGSLQSGGTQISLKKEGNTEDMTYNFYCRSIYRIHIGDFIKYKNRFLYVERVQDYDEWGVREATLRMVNLNNHRDFTEALKYLEGEILI